MMRFPQLFCEFAVFQLVAPSLRKCVRQSRERDQPASTSSPNSDRQVRRDYLLACACDEIVMPESGSLTIPGIRAEVTFFGGLFEKLGIKADMMQVGDFKGAAEPFTRKGMSKEFRQQYQLLIDDFFEQMVETISKDRKLDRKQTEALIDVGLFTAEAAKEAGLIDTVAYDDQTSARLKKQLKVDKLSVISDYGKKKVDTDFSGMLGFIKLFELMTGAEPSKRTNKNKKLALVYAVGPIMTGSSSTDILGNLYGGK